MNARVVVLGAGLSLTGSLFALTVNVDADEVQTLSDALSGSEELVKTGAGTLVLGNANAGWIGSIDVQEGTLQSACASLGAKGDLRVRTGARLLFSDAEINIGSTPSRHGYLAGKVEHVKGVTFANNTWYPFKDVTLEGDVEFVNSGNVVGWGSLDMGGYTITSNGGTLSLPRMNITNFGQFVKNGGYLVVSDRKSMTFYEGGVVKLSGGATLKLLNCPNSKLACRIESVSGKNWIMTQMSGETATTNDNVFAGELVIAEDAELQSWPQTETKEKVIIEGPVSGEGTFSTADLDGSDTILRGAEQFGPDVKVIVNTQLIVERSRFASFCPQSVAIPYDRHLVLVDPDDNAILSQLVEKVSVNGNKAGRVRIRLTGEGENAYDGPFKQGIVFFEAPNGSVVTTNGVTANLLKDVTWSNLGTWILNGDPTASLTLNGFYYNHHLVFNNLGTVTIPDWICTNLRSTGNPEPYRLDLRGETHLVAKEIFAGLGGNNGVGVITIEDPASAEGCFWVGKEVNDRGAVYQRGGTVRNIPVSTQSGWSGVGAKTTSNGAWIQRGGTNEVSVPLWLGFEPHAYGAFVLHDGLTRVNPNGQLRIGCGGRGVFYQDGGCFTNCSQYYVNVNIDSPGGIVDESSFTLDGTADFSSGQPLGTWKRNSLTRYNLNGGTLTVPCFYLCDDDYISGNYKNCIIHLGFNGGTVRFAGNATDFLFGYQPSERSHPTTLTVYEGGATVETVGSTRRAMFGFSAPTGLGVKSVTLPETIGGVALADVKTPCQLKFFFVGGNGSADAMVDFDDLTGKVAGVKMLSSGCGYTEAPKAYVVAPGGTVTNECVVEMFEPKGGGFTKKGDATLWLDQPNTYAGPTVIAEGMLRFSQGCIPPAADITIAEGAQFWPAKSVDDNIIDTLRGTGIGWYDVTLTNRLVVSYADAREGKVMWFKEGTVTSLGAKVVLSDPEALTDDAKSVKILVADNGLWGSFSFTLPEEATGKGWQLVQRGTYLRLVNRNRGLSLIIR